MPETLRSTGASTYYDSLFLYEIVLVSPETSMRCRQRSTWWLSRRRFSSPSFLSLGVPVSSTSSSSVQNSQTWSGLSTRRTTLENLKSELTKPQSVRWCPFSKNGTATSRVKESHCCLCSRATQELVRSRVSVSSDWRKISRTPSL
jgi:hypothetical protein